MSLQHSDVNFQERDARAAAVVQPYAIPLSTTLAQRLVSSHRAKYGSEVEDAFQMEQRGITKSLNEIKSALQKGKPMQRWVGTAVISGSPR